MSNTSLFNEYSVALLKSVKNRPGITFEVNWNGYPLSGTNVTEYFSFVHQIGIEL